MLRAIAVLMIVFQHIEYLLNWPANPYHFIRNQFGFWGGVDLFFCISGYVIARTLMGEIAAVSGPATVSNFAVPFWMRRAWRLWPAGWFWAATALILSVAFNRSGTFGEPAAMGRDALAAVLHYANIHWMHCFNYGTGLCNLAGMGEVDAPNIKGWLLAIYWSLSLEEQFYLLLPAFFLLLPRRLLVWLLLVGISAQITLGRPPLSVLWYFRTDALLIGVVLAIAETSRPANLHGAFRSIDRHSLLAKIIALPLVLAIARLGAGQYDQLRYATGLIAVASGCLVWLASLDQNHLVLLGGRLRAMAWLGSRSYSVYLTHLIAFAVIREGWSRMPFGHPSLTWVTSTIYLVSALVLTIIFAECSFRMIERPLRQFGRRLVAKRYRPSYGRSAGDPSSVSSSETSILN